ncbi:hypothetical protein CAEBREN_12402 [Caenorhabditis brenneri]|uniref:Uncharacterized protein n=1 Tax=Caenorhabditis brenneri TaxID=135651 RepID=G0NKZ1_CAEBE|nr:hypothetical protein CAEBREN_12402 [Caenorhabditis brenneri]
MSLDDQQKRISTTALVSPGIYFLLRLVQVTTKIKFPDSGPNELLFADSILAGLVCYTASHMKFLQYAGRMVIITFIRFFFLIFLFISIYVQPQWYHVHKTALDHSICWILMSIHIVCTTVCLTMSFTVLAQERVINFFSWQDVKEYFFPPQSVHPPRYQDAISSAALPPSYEEALAARPPGYTPTNTPPVDSPTQVSVHVSRCSTQDRYQAAAEEAETMF